MSTTIARDIATRVNIAAPGSLSPVIEWRASTGLHGVIVSRSPIGSGFAGAIPAGTSSNVITVRLYNNFQGGGGIADALNCQLAVYDDAIHQGVGATLPTTGLYVQVQVVDYNGSTAGADSQYYAIGGQTKHAVPTNGGTIGGSSTNYVTINLKIVVPSTATQGSVAQGLWIEYTATA